LLCWQLALVMFNVAVISSGDVSCIMVSAVQKF